MDRIQYADGKEGFVSDIYLEAPVTTVGKGVSPPVPIYSAEPAYTEEARHDRLQGTLRLLITIDSQGTIADVQEISEPLGDGLDQNGIDAVKTWRFTPAKRDGVPVAVRVQVEVTFRLYHKAP
jgi:protein TonB